MKKRYIFLITIIVLLVAFRLYLPTLVRNQINNRIAERPGFSGGVNKVTLQLIRGAVQVHDVQIKNDGSNDPSTPFISLAYADVSISWRSLIKGHVVVEILFETLDINFTLYEKEPPDAEDAFDLSQLLDDLVPFRIQTLRIINSSLAYRDVTTSPPVEIYLSGFHCQVENIQNIENYNDTLPATVVIQSSVMNSGSIYLDASMNLQSQIPDFDYRLTIENVDLSVFNSFFEAYANFTVNKGEMNLYSESASRDGEVKGYLKPVIEHLEITPTEKGETTLAKLWEGVLEVVTEILENPKTDRIGTQIEFNGSINDPEVGVWPAVWKLLRNAFLESITKGVEHSIDFNQL